MDESLHQQRKGSGNELDSEEHTEKEIDKYRAKNEMFQNSGKGWDTEKERVDCDSDGEIKNLF